MSTPTNPMAPVVPSAGRVRPLPMTDVQFTGGLWADRQAVNAAATIAHCADWEENVGWIGNFDRVAAGTIGHGRRGREFSDSDVYKMLEAMAWEMGRSGPGEFAARFDAIVARIAAAQHKDGYLNTCFGNPGQPPRYSNLEWGHELYCYGHLFQAAVARLRTGHDRDDLLVSIALRAADHVCDAFGPGGIESVCGHPEVEVGLAELSRATGEARYLEQARLFVERRGHGTLQDIEWGRAYYQDDVPVRDAEVLRGHAVRALYLAAGALDVACETGDTALFDAVAHQYSATLARRTYLTGGMGSHHQDEAFGTDFELPPDRAYCETCAGVASIMVAWRLALATGEARWADQIERTLFNVVNASPAEDGRSFFYSNPLQLRVPGAPAAADHVSPRAESSLRAPWFDVSCCPNNVARTFASLSAYCATASDDAVQLHQFAPMTIDTVLPAGRVRLRVETDYPADGAVLVRVEEAPAGPWQLALRVPAWSGQAAVSGAGAETARIEAGWAHVSGLASGDQVRLDLDVAPRWTLPDPRIDAVRGCAAVEAGPVVLCLESVDVPSGLGIDQVRAVIGTPPKPDDDGARIEALIAGHTDLPWPYTTAPPAPPSQPSELHLIPYHRWANRGPATMRVFLPLA